MSAPFERLAALDRLIHEPARLAILTALAACQSAEFLFLQRLTGLTKGNLSSHLAKLEEGGLVLIEKTFSGKTPHTFLRLTDDGRQAIAAHWQRLEQLGRAAQQWKPDATHSTLAAGADEPN
jgi:DNA-binding transcriptional ArsR family regulator